MYVSEIMSTRVVTAQAAQSVYEAARLMEDNNIGAIPVVEGSELKGMLTDRDIVLRCVAAEEDPAQTLVRDIMTRGCASVSPYEDCRAATRLMAQQQVRRLPVVEEQIKVMNHRIGDLEAREERGRRRMGEGET